MGETEGSYERQSVSSAARHLLPKKLGGLRAAKRRKWRRRLEGGSEEVGKEGVKRGRGGERCTR